MTEKKAPNRRKAIDWKKKSGTDSERISKRLEGRAELKDSATQNNAPKTAVTQTVISGKALVRLKTKIREIYDEDEEEDNTPAFFNISLLEHTPEEIERQKKEKETDHIAKQQQLTGRLNTIMSSSMAAKKAGLSSKMTAEDARLADSPELDNGTIRRKTLHNKIEKPLGLKGNLQEKDLEHAVKGLNKALTDLPPDSLKDYPAAAAAELDFEIDEKEMAKLILEKTGRRNKKKNLAEIAKGLNKFKKYEKENDDGKENT